jgi:hypothetical protein
LQTSTELGYFSALFAILQESQMTFQEFILESVVPGPHYLRT